MCLMDGMNDFSIIALILKYFLMILSKKKIYKVNFKYVCYTIAFHIALILFIVEIIVSGIQPRTLYGATDIEVKWIIFPMKLLKEKKIYAALIILF